MRRTTRSPSARDVNAAVCLHGAAEPAGTPEYRAARGGRRVTIAFPRRGYQSVRTLPDMAEIADPPAFAVRLPASVVWGSPIERVERGLRRPARPAVQ